MKKYLSQLLLFLFLCTHLQNFAQTEAPPVYSPDGEVRSIISKGDTLIVGGNFNHVGIYTGGGAVFPSNSRNPILTFPKLIGVIVGSTPDGSGGLYIVGRYKRENDDTVDANLLRIEHILANNTFEPGFSFVVNSSFNDGELLYNNGILYFGGFQVSQVAGHASGNLAAIDINTKSLIPSIPIIGDFGVKGFCINQNTLYVIGVYSAVAINTLDWSIKPWNPTSNLGSFGRYSGIASYGDKIILSGTFYNGFAVSCAMVDTVSGQNHEYIFKRGASPNSGFSPLDQGDVSALAIKGDTLYTFSTTGNRGGTRITAVNIGPGPDHNNTIWTRHFNGSAFCYGTLALVDNSIFVVGKGFDSIFRQSYLIQSDTVEKIIKGGVKLNASDGTLENWYPDPVGYKNNDIYSICSVGSNIFIGGNFSHVNGFDRTAIYMVNSQTDTILPFRVKSIDGWWGGWINSLKLFNDTLYAGGFLFDSSSQSQTVTAYKIDDGSQINLGAPALGEATAIEVNNSAIFLCGRLFESPENDNVSLFALNRKTGELINWKPNPSGNMYSLLLSQDKLYVCGDSNFTTISGQSRSHVASFDTLTLELTSWNSIADNAVRAIHRRDNTLWLGGSFLHIGDSARNMLAGVSPLNGAVRPSPYLNSGNINSIQSKGMYLFLGGSFRLNYSTMSNNYMLYNLYNKSFIPGNLLFKGINDSEGKISTIAISGNDVFYGGDFVKINGKATATFIGRLKYSSGFFSQGEDYISVQNGNWNEASTWEKNEVPPETARVKVKHNVIITQNTICYSLLVEKPFGNLNVNPAVSLKILSEY